MFLEYIREFILLTLRLDLHLLKRCVSVKLLKYLSTVFKSRSNVPILLSDDRVVGGNLEKKNERNEKCKVSLSLQPLEIHFIMHNVHIFYAKDFSAGIILFGKKRKNVTRSR